MRIVTEDSSWYLDPHPPSSKMREQEGTKGQRQEDSAPRGG